MNSNSDLRHLDKTAACEISFVVCDKWQPLWAYNEESDTELQLSIFVMCKKWFSISLKPMGVFRAASSTGFRSEATENWHLIKLEMSNYQNLDETGLRRWERLPVQFLCRAGYAAINFD